MCIATPLLLAIRHRNIENALCLIRHGADVKLATTDNQTALLYACQYHSQNLLHSELPGLKL